jgi:hypothetical protein
MLEINIPEVLAELTEAFEAYERALIDNDIAAVNELFWHNPDTVRFGARDSERQYGYAEIAEFRLKRGPVDQRRTLHNRRIMTFGSNFGVATVEYVLVDSSKIGRQSQMWMRTEGGWKIVSAHVSFGV